MSGWHVIAFQMKTLLSAQAITIWCWNVHHNAFYTIKVHIVICTNAMPIVHSAFNRWQWHFFFSLYKCVYFNLLSSVFGPQKLEFVFYSSFYFCSFVFLPDVILVWSIELFLLLHSRKKNIRINLNFIWYGWLPQESLKPETWTPNKNTKI